jgi:hypothetical protein
MGIILGMAEFANFQNCTFIVGFTTSKHQSYIELTSKGNRKLHRAQEQ